MFASVESEILQMPSGVWRMIDTDERKERRLPQQLQAFS